jgi:carboxymethylenebutenolidase
MAEEAPRLLPQAELKTLTDGVTLLPPLFCGGHGPGMIIVLPTTILVRVRVNGGSVCINGLPPPLLRWSEEGFAVVQILESVLHSTLSMNDVFELAVSTLENCEQCDSENGVGMVSK